MKQDFQSTRGTLNNKTDNTASNGQSSNVFQRIPLVDGLATCDWKRKYPFLSPEKKKH